ncbi:type II toxin-antitoxin system PemK/MazF family toxin [Asaia sp. As-1742]|nr:type II toxin-antitoxin system PemK/MazF family toxin [Asaia sp. As-1742]
MVTFDVWDVVAVPFPYTNRSVQQRRPALVVGRHSHEGGPPLLWVLMITSASHRTWHGDVVISDPDGVCLPAPSMVRTAKIATIEARDAEKLSSLPPENRSDVAGYLRATFADLAHKEGDQ